MELNADELEIARRIDLLLFDCDGVLTDGRLYFSAEGEAMKAFHVRDGQGIVLWHEAGYRSGIISGRDSGGIVETRAKELGMDYVVTASEDKINDLEKILSETGIESRRVAYVGDDIGDIGLMGRVGLPVAVADAVDEAKAAARYITKMKGGEGAVREVIDLLLSVKGS
ncbi:MAG TPA: HAD hydrolase family protein [Pyrinomonadaceae bacterium]|nr:HAD hydrolase family protein [Pyrinomonadaceae bacterium]HMP66813.1 HAD hydrolase family protein [Pyrinomonadaceae bacterium]